MYNREVEISPLEIGRSPRMLWWAANATGYYMLADISPLYGLYKEHQQD